MPRPKPDVPKNSTELSTAGKRAQLEILISKLSYLAETNEQTFAAIISVHLYIVSQQIAFTRPFINKVLNFLDENPLTTLDKNGIIALTIPLSIVSLFIVSLNYSLAPLFFGKMKKIYHRIAVALNVEPYDAISLGRSIAKNPMATLTEIDNALTEMDSRANSRKKYGYFFLSVALIILLAEIWAVLCLSYTVINKPQIALLRGRDLIIEILFVVTITAPIWIEMFRNFMTRRNQYSLESCNYDLLHGFTKDLQNITLKRNSNNALGYIALLFKIEDFKTVQNLRFNGRDFSLSYKDVFEGMLYCIGLVKSMKVTKMDKHSIILSADINYHITYTIDELRQKLFIFLDHKNNIIELKDKILWLLNEATSSLAIDWQAVEKRNDELPNILFIADIANLNQTQTKYLDDALLKIYPERVKFHNNEIIVEPNKQDIHTGYKQHYRDLKNQLEGRLPIRPPQQKTSQSLPSSYSAGMAGNKIPSKPVQPVAAALPASLSKAESTNSFSFKWPNGITYEHFVEQTKPIEDDTRIIPLSCGRNNTIFYKRFLVIDPKLKDEIKDKELYKRYLGCFWKSIPPQSNEQGRKRVITAYRDCHGKQQISEWEVKIPRTDPRAYIRILDQSNPNAILYIADGWNPHPHKK